MSDPVVVIGAGPAGLAAAHALLEQGHRPTVIEAQAHVGGLSGSFDVGGFRADYGPHRLHRAASPEVLALCLRATSGLLRTRMRSGVVHVAGRRVPFPLSLPGLVRGLGPVELFRFGLSAATAKLAPPRRGGFDGEVRRRLGRRAARLLYEPAARKVWGLSPHELDERLGRARVSKAGPLAVLRAAVGRGAGSGRKFFYPANGFGAICEGLAAELERRGGTLVRGAPVDGLGIERGRVRSVRTGGREVAASRVIATAPLPSLCGFVGAGERAEGLSYRALTLLYLVLGTSRASGNDVHYFADESLPASRLFEAKGFSGGVGPRDTTVVGFDLPCAVGDATWTASPEALREKVQPALEAVGQGAAKVLGIAVRRTAFAYPIYRRGFGPRRDGALDALAQLEGLYPVGRQALFVHDNLHHACAAGLLAGRAAAAGLTARQWRRALAPLLESSIED